MTFDEYQQQALITAINDYEPLMAKTIWAMGRRLGLSFEDVMQRNVAKLKSRQTRGVVKGQGDNR